MTGKYLVRNEDEFKQFKTLLKLNEYTEDILERLALRREPIVLHIEDSKYEGYMMLRDIPNAEFQDIRNWLDKDEVKEWRHLV